MGLNRYFVPNLPTTGTIHLPSEEAHHALRVRRETTGGFCVAFDGCGNVAHCQFVEATKLDMVIKVESYRFEPNELPGKLQLAVAMPKGDRQKAVIEKAVELGVHELVPLICHRSVSLPSQSTSDRWLRTVIETCKQCERNRLMTFGSPCTFESMLQTLPSVAASGSLRMFAHPKDGKLHANEYSSLYDHIAAMYPRMMIAIGPEGGFTDSEADLALEAGWQQLDFGPRILRVETAVCASSIYGSLRLKDDDRVE